MSRSIKTLTVAALALVALTAAVSDSSACGHGGGSSYRGGYNNYSRVQHTPVYRQPVHIQPAPQQVFVQPAPIQPQVIQQQIVQPQVQVAPAQIAPAQIAQPQAQAASVIAPQQSALQMLAAMGAMPEATAPMAGHIGTWTANLANNTSVRLELSANGQFSWSANKGGKVSSFAGTFSMTNGQLTLIRSNDQQQLRGNWTAQAAGNFNFRLDGAKDNGLSFSRS